MAWAFSMIKAQKWSGNRNSFPPRIDEVRTLLRKCALYFRVGRVFRMVLTQKNNSHFRWSPSPILNLDGWRFWKKTRLRLASFRLTWTCRNQQEQSIAILSLSVQFNPEILWVISENSSITIVQKNCIIISKKKLEIFRTMHGKWRSDLPTQQLALLLLDRLRNSSDNFTLVSISRNKMYLVKRESCKKTVRKMTVGKKSVSYVH